MINVITGISCRVRAVNSLPHGTHLLFDLFFFRSFNAYCFLQIKLNLLLILCREFSCEGENPRADRVAESHNSEVKESFCAPHIRNGNVEHIGDAVLVSADDKSCHAEEKSEILADLVRIVCKAVNRYENHHVTE